MQWRLCAKLLPFFILPEPCEFKQGMGTGQNSKTTYIDISIHFIRMFAIITAFAYDIANADDVMWNLGFRIPVVIPFLLILL